MHRSITSVSMLSSMEVVRDRLKVAAWPVSHAVLPCNTCAQFTGELLDVLSGHCFSSRVPITSRFYCLLGTKSPDKKVQEQPRVMNVHGSVTVNQNSLLPSIKEKLG
jgi:hypothetical protein